MCSLSREEIIAQNAHYPFFKDINLDSCRRRKPELPVKQGQRNIRLTKKFQSKEMKSWLKSMKKQKKAASGV